MADPTNTKIIATTGPASSSGDVLAPLIDAGADLIRFNLSHSRGEERQKMLEAVRNVARERATFVGLLGNDYVSGSLKVPNGHAVLPHPRLSKNNRSVRTE